LSKYHGVAGTPPPPESPSRRPPFQGDSGSTGEGQVAKKTKKIAALTSRSQFIRDSLKANPSATAGEVARAWKAGGGNDEIKPSLYFNVKQRMATVRRPRRGPNDPPRPAPVKKKPAEVFQEIARALDFLIVRAVRAGADDLERALRAARRTASRS